MMKHWPGNHGHVTRRKADDMLIKQGRLGVVARQKRRAGACGIWCALWVEPAVDILQPVYSS